MLLGHKKKVLFGTAGDDASGDLPNQCNTERTTDKLQTSWQTNFRPSALQHSNSGEDSAPTR